MTLNEWIDENGKTMKEVAKDLFFDYENIRRYCAGEVIPRPDRMQKIVEYTAGAVTPNDFYIKGE